MKHIGFTGTQKGMTERQREVIKALLTEQGFSFVSHHGDCIGADSDFHDIICLESDCQVVLHPCNIESKRAFCKLEITDECHAPKDPLVRNRNIVNASGLVFACPGEKIMKVRSGTWSTVRYAQSVRVPVIIVFPDGTLART